MMRRRRILLTLGLLGVALRAQPGERVWRVGVLRANKNPATQGENPNTGLRQALRALDYEEGRNLLLFERFGEGEPKRLPVLARELAAARADVVLSVGSLATQAARENIASTPVVFFGNFEQAAKHRLPAIYEWREQVVDGGLMAYSTSLAGQYERIASHIDRIFKGASPGDLPIERPYRFELVVNLKTAKALGLEVPRALLLRADEVIE